MADAVNPSIPLEPPAEWFTPPTSMPKDAGCIVEPDGRIYGYLCHWGSILMDGSSDRWKPPRSRAAYSWAHTGDTVCADGSTIKTANLGGDAGHARGISNDDPDRLAKLQAFYENTQTQLARVRYGEDEHGIWFAGACWPTVTDLDIAKLRASARSGHWAAVGDWKDIGSGRPGYELVGACLVNIPGLKYARADRVASGVISMSPVQLEADHSGAMVALFLDAATAAELAIPGGEPAESLHITLAYFEDAGGDRADWDVIHALVANIGAKHLPLAGRIGGQGVFRNDGTEVHWAAPDIPGLSDLRTELVHALDLAGFEVRKDHGFTPHVTLAYTDPGAPAPLVDTHDVSFDRLTLAVGGDMTELETRTAWDISASGTIQMDSVPLDAAPVDVPVSGVLVIEDQVTEDGRLIQANAVEWRELPLPLYAKLENTGGHDDAVLVGRIDTIFRDKKDPKRVMYTGVIDPTTGDGYGQQVLSAIDGKRLRGVSIDGIAGPDDAFVNDNEVLEFRRMVIGGATLTPMPAISEASVTIGEDADAPGEDFAVDDELAVGDDGGTTTEEQVEDAQEETASDDKFDAILESLAALAAGQQQLIEIVQSGQMNARYEAALRRLSAADA